MTTDVTSLSSKLYAAFSKYSFKPGFLARCSPLTPPTNEEYDALRKPLKELSIDDLGRLPGSVMNTWGDEEDFKYFLPRIAELSVISLEDNIFDYAFFPRLKDVNLAAWDEDERNAVYEVLSHYILINTEAFARGESFSGYLPDAIQIMGTERFKTALREDYTANAAFFIAAQRLNGVKNMGDLDQKIKDSLENWFLSIEGEDILRNGLNRSNDEVINFTIQTALNTI